MLDREARVSTSPWSTSREPSPSAAARVSASAIAPSTGAHGATQPGSPQQYAGAAAPVYQPVIGAYPAQIPTVVMPSAPPAQAPAPPAPVSPPPPAEPHHPPSHDSYTKIVAKPHGRSSSAHEDTLQKIADRLSSQASSEVDYISQDSDDIPVDPKRKRKKDKKKKRDKSPRQKKAAAAAHGPSHHAAAPHASHREPRHAEAYTQHREPSHSQAHAREQPRAHTPMTYVEPSPPVDTPVTYVEPSYPANTPTTYVEPSYPANTPTTYVEPSRPQAHTDYVEPTYSQGHTADNYAFESPYPSLPPAQLSVPDPAPHNKKKKHKKKASDHAGKHSAAYSNTRFPSKTAKAKKSKGN